VCVFTRCWLCKRRCGYCQRACGRVQPVEMVNLPGLFLKHTGLACGASDIDDVRAAWFTATGKTGKPSRSWKGFDAQDKRRLLHDVARAAQTEEQEYYTPYREMSMKKVTEKRVWSVEHVVPRSKCQMAQADPWNFIEAVRSENSARSNLPLKLWPDASNQMSISKFQMWNFEQHYAPPPHQRARLARKWLYTRATYGCMPMSKAQREHLPAIIALARHTPPDVVEVNVAKQLEAITGTRNPLILDSAPERWYDDVAWRSLVGCTVGTVGR
jgi:endonuclease I